MVDCFLPEVSESEIPEFGQELAQVWTAAQYLD
jgi:hypothetical protein